MLWVILFEREKIIYAKNRQVLPNMTVLYLLTALFDFNLIKVLGTYKFEWKDLGLNESVSAFLGIVISNGTYSAVPYPSTVRYRTPVR